MAYKYDLFISFSSKDAAWAEKLYRDLRARGLNPERIFYAEESIRVGDEWREKLNDGIVTSRNLVLLWSDHARTSDWVDEESKKFKLMLEAEAGQQPEGGGRRIIFIPLQGDNDVFRKYQVADYVAKVNAYEGGPGRVDPGVWGRVVERVAQAATADPNVQPVKLVVLTMTQDRINRLNLGTLLPDARTSLAEAVRRMGLAMQIEFLDRLDPTLTLPIGRTLEQVFAELGVQTASNPADRGEVRIVVGGETLGQLLKRRGLRTMDELLLWVEDNPDFVLPNGQTLAAALAARFMTVRPSLEHLLMKVALRQYYGPSQLDWRPFGNPSFTISDIMWRIAGEFNRWPQAPIKFEWDMAGDFWSEGREADLERVRLATGEAVIVVDPLSLYDEEVSTRFSNLMGAFRNKRALVMAFAPFALPTPTGMMRTLINHKAVEMFRSFYQPRLAVENMIAKCGPDVGDEVDVKRWLQTALWPQASGGTSSKKVTASQEADAFMGR